MVNAKLSNLQAATLAGGELIYIVSGGNSRKATLGAIGAQLMQDTGQTAARTTLGVSSTILPAISANTMLVDDTGGNQRENKTFAQVASLIGFKQSDRDTVAQMLNNYALIVGNVTVTIPTDVATLNAAMTAVSRWVVADGALVTLAFTDGDQPHSSTIVIDHPYASKFLVTSANGIISPTFVSVTSVTGSAGNWSVTYSITGGASITTAMCARIAAPKGRRAHIIAGRVNLNSASTTVSGTDTVFNAGDVGLVDQTQSITIDRVLGGNQVRTIDTVTNNTSFTVTVAPSASVNPAMLVAATANAVGTGTIQVTGTAVAGTGTAFDTELTVGDVVFWTDDPSAVTANAAWAGVVTSITNATAAVLDTGPPVNSGATRSFVVGSNIYAHCGAHRITAASATSITVLNKSLSKPAVFGVTDLAIRIPRSTLRMTADVTGIEIAAGRMSPTIKDISIRGTASGNLNNDHGISVGRVQSADQIIQKGGTLLLEASTAILDFAGSGLFVRSGFASADFVAISGCYNGIAASVGGVVEARSACLVGNTSRGATAPIGGVLNLEEARIAGNAVSVSIGSGAAHLAYATMFGSTSEHVIASGGTIDTMNNTTVMAAGTDGIKIEGGQVNGDDINVQASGTHGINADAGGFRGSRASTHANGGDGIRCSDGAIVRNQTGYSCTNVGNGRYALRGGIIYVDTTRAYYNGDYAARCLGPLAAITHTNGGVAGNVGGTFLADAAGANTLSALGSYIRTT